MPNVGRRYKVVAQCRSCKTEIWKWAQPRLDLPTFYSRWLHSGTNQQQCHTTMASPKPGTQRELPP